MNPSDIKTKILTNVGNDDLISKILQDNFTSMCLNQNLAIDLLNTLEVDKNLISTLKLCKIRTKGIKNATICQLKSFLNTLNALVQSCQQIPSKLFTFRNQFSEVFVTVANLLCERNNANLGINLMCNAIELLQKSSSESVLTSLHSPLCQLCLKSKNLKPVLKYLNAEVCQNGKELGDITSNSYLSFYYYGGIIYAMLKQYDRSLYFLEQAITIPAVSVSQIMAESYKKYMLISLAYKGKVAELPKYTSTIMLNYVKQSMSCYNKLAEAFEKSSIAKFEEVFFQYENTFQQDKNVGLIKIIKNCITQKKILNLTKTFSTLSLSDIIDRAQLSCTVPELENKISKMIKEKEIIGKIDQKNKMMIFHHELERPTLINALTDRQINTLMSLNSQIENMNIQLLLNPLVKRKTMESKLSKFPDHSMIGSYNYPSSSTPGLNMVRNVNGGK